MRLLALATTAGIALCGCAVLGAAVAPPPLDVRTLQATVVRMGSLHGKPLYGIRLRGYVCSRSAADADRTVPISFRIAHYVTAGRTTTGWGKPFRVVDNDLYWVVSLGEARGACGYVVFEDVIPPENYGGVESALGALGYSDRYRCYGVQLTVRAALGSPDRRIAATRRAIVQCGRFHPG